MKVGDCDDHSLQAVADLDKAGLQDKGIETSLQVADLDKAGLQDKGIETSLQAVVDLDEARLQDEVNATSLQAAGNAPGSVVPPPTTPVATNVDPFILELYRLIEAQSADPRKMMTFVSEGGFRLSNHDKKELSDALILEPNQRALPPLFPKSWILFMNLLGEYGFQCTRGSLNNAARKFTHPEFKEGGQLHLIQKGISPTTNRPFKKLKVKGKKTPPPAKDVLSKHLGTQHQITLSAQEIHEGFLKLRDSAPVNVNRTKEQMVILEEHMMLLEEEISLVVNWAQICESELISMTGSWKAGFWKQSVTVLTWKHVELVDLCEIIGSKVAKGDFRVPTVEIGQYLMKSYAKLSDESKEQVRKVENAVKYLLKRRTAPVDAFAAGPSDAGSAKAGASATATAMAFSGPGLKKSAADVNKKSSPKIAPGASADSSFTRAAGRGKRTTSLSASAGTGSSRTAGRGMITAPHAYLPVRGVVGGPVPTTRLLRPQTGLSSPALGVEGSPPGMMQPRIIRPSRAIGHGVPTNSLHQPQSRLSAPALGFGVSPPGMMQPQINGPVIRQRQQEAEMQGGGHGGPPPHDRERPGVPPIMTREAPPRRGMLGPSRPRMLPRSPNLQQQKSQ